MSASSDSGGRSGGSRGKGSSSTSKSAATHELFLVDDPPKSRPLSKTSEDGKTTAAAYHLQLPPEWGTMVVRYEERPPAESGQAREEDLEKNLRLIFRMGASDGAPPPPEATSGSEPKTTVSSPAEGGGTKKSTKSPLLPASDSSASMESPRSPGRRKSSSGGGKYVQVNWNEWTYIEPKVKTTKVTSSATGKNAALNEDLIRMRAKFDAILAQLAKGGETSKSSGGGSKSK